MFVLSIPNFVPMLVNYFAPIPPQSKILLEKDAVRRRVEKEWEPKLREELGASGKYTEPMDLVIELRRRLRIEYNRQTEKIDRFYNNRIRRQLVLNQQISRLSPSAAYIYASTHLAGTGVGDFLNVLVEVDAFQQEYLEVKEEQEAKRLAEEEKRKKEKWKPKKGEKLIDRYDPSLWPEFEPQKISLASALNKCWIDLVLLAGGGVALFLLSFIGFLRYDPR
jgi:hypothetical protein